VASAELVKENDAVGKEEKKFGDVERADVI
jgi:hypothetical protein